MADYRTISSGFWNDPYIEELEPQEKLLYIYLFTCPHINNAGILHISPRKMAFETGIKDVATLIKKFSDDDKLVECEGYFWVVNFIKHQSSTSPKIIQSIGKALHAAPVSLVDRVLKHYKALQIPYAYPIDTLCIPYAERELERERELEGEEEDSSPSETPPPEPESKESLPKAFLESEFREEAYEFADWFRTITSGSVKFDRDAWAREWDKLRRIDGRKDKKDICQAIEWARGDPFWSTNFHSPLKLRKRNDDGVMYIDVFIEKMKQPKRRNNAADSTEDGNPHAKANAAAIEALQRGDFAESMAGVGNRSG